MKSIRILVITVWFLLLITTAVFAQGSGKEWDVLQEEAMNLWSSGKHDEALVVAEKAVRVAEKNLGPNHHDVAVALNSLANFYNMRGQYEQAKTFFKRSLDVLEKILGPDHPELAVHLDNLANVYYHQRQYEQTELLFKRSLAISEKHLGPENVGVALAMNKLARLYMEQNKFDQAEPLYKRSLAISEIAIGPNNTFLAESLENMAEVYRMTRRDREADALDARVVRIRAIIQSHAQISDWDKYMQFTDRFYTLDNQDFESISCDIEVPLTKNQVKEFYAQFEPMKGKIEIKENLADFSLTYSKKSGLNISYPLLYIKIISEVGMADPAKVKKGIEMVKTGFKQQIEGTAMQLQGFFEGFEKPKKNQYKIKEIKDEISSYTAKYEKKGSDITEKYSNKYREFKEISKNGDKISSVEKYEHIANNKLLLTYARAIMKNATSNTEMNMNMTISYEKVKDIIFPSHIKGYYFQSIESTMQSRGKIDIYFKNCTLR